MSADPGPDRGRGRQAQGGASGKCRYDHTVGFAPFAASPPLQQESGASSRLAREKEKLADRLLQGKVLVLMPRHRGQVRIHPIGYHLCQIDNVICC